MAIAYQDLGTLEQDLGSPAEAEDSAFKARQILRELAAEDPTWLERPLDAIIDYRGRAALRDEPRNAGETRSAEQVFFENLPALVDETPPFHGPNVDRALAWRLAMSPVATRYDPDRRVESAEEASLLAEHDVGYSNTLGVMQYRAGDWKAATDTLQRSIDLRLRGNGTDLFCLAMAHWRLGEEHQARKLYDQAVEWMEANRPDAPEFRRFRAEAEALLNQAQVAP